MAIVFMEGFDHYGHIDYVKGGKWTSVVEGDSSYYSNCSLDSGRVAGNSFAIRRIWFGEWASITCSKTVPSQTTYISGGAWKLISGAPNNHREIMSYREGSNYHVTLTIHSDGKLYVKRGDRSGSSLGNTTITLNANTWYYIEFKATIHASTGTAVVKVDGTEVLNISGANTKGPSASTTNITAVGFATFNDTPMDDLYLADTTGTTNLDFLGDCRVVTVMPAADGSTTDWVASSAGAHYLKVDEVPPNGDTDWVDCNVVDNVELFTMAAAPTSYTVKAVQRSSYARREDASVSKFAHVCRSGGTTYGMAEADFVLTDSYQYYTSVRNFDPNGDIEWTPTNVNAAEFGCKLVL